MKRGFWTALLLGAGCILSGCSSSFSPEVNGISISKKGVITEVSRESFDKGYYNEEELENGIDAEIVLYNSQAGDKAVSKKSFHVKDGVAELRMTYATAKDYADFNGLDFYLGDIPGAVQEGFTFEGQFYGVSGTVVQEDRPLFGSQVMTGKNYSTVATNEQMLVEVPGTIRYVSANVRLTDTDTAVIDQGQEAYILYE